jgi:hypothetical protein
MASSTSERAVTIQTETPPILTKVGATLEEVTIIMTMPNLKALSQHLSKIVDLLETEIGPIKMTKSSQMSDENLEIVRNNLRANPLTE